MLSLGKMNTNKTINYIVLRYFVCLKGSGFSGFLAWVSMLSCMLGVMALIFVLNLMNGFEVTLLNRIISSNSHVTIQIEDDDIENAMLFLSDVAANKDIVDFSFTSSATVIANINDNIAPVAVKWPQDMRSFSENIGEQIEADVNSNLASNFDLMPGDYLTLYLMNKDAFFQPPEVLSIIIRSVHSSNIDSGIPTIYLDNLISNEGALIADVHEISLWVERPSDVDFLVNSLKENYPFMLNVISWKGRNASLFDAIKTEKVFMSIMIGVIIFVSMFNLYSSLSYLFNRKKLDFSILRGLGMSRHEVESIMALYPLLIVAIGVFLGVLLGSFLSLYLDDIAFYLYENFGETVLTFEVFYLSQIPAVISISQYLLTILIVLIMAYLTILLFVKREMKISIADHLKGNL